ncbi:MAG: hypothetical protein IMZ53_12750 [Thermoplasmata archaeon]|nr:hypothetical protein [Thermoplasmata archaeon]
MAKLLKHITINYKKQPPEFVCERCQVSRQVHLPALIKDFIKQGEAFSASHEYCQKKKNG